MPTQPLLVLKTSVAQHLVDSAPLVVHLQGDNFWHYIKKGWIPPYLDGSQHQNEVVTAALGAAGAEYAAGGYMTVLETIVGSWLLRHAVAPGAERGVTVSYVILRPSADVTMARAVARASGALRDPGPVRKMYEAFSNLGPFEQYVIDSSLQTAEETATEVWRRVREGAAVVDPALLPDGL